MTTRNLLKALAITAALGLSLTACGSSDDGNDKTGTSSSGASDLKLVKAGTLTVCSDVPYPPFEDFDKSADSGFKGFDVDIVSKIAEGLDLKLKIKDSSFDALQSGQSLNAGQCDLVASAMTITDDRTFLEDGDEVVLRATAPGALGGRIALGEVAGRITPA